MTKSELTSILCVSVMLILSFDSALHAQMRLADVQPGMERARVINELQKQYTQEMGYRINNSSEGTSVWHWIKQGDTEIPEDTEGLILYRGGRVSVVKEYYKTDAVKASTDLLRALITELRPYLKQDASFKGHPSRHGANAQIILDDYTA